LVSKEVLEELEKLFRDRELEVEKTKNTIRGVHSNLPIQLVVKIDEKAKTAVVSIEPGEDLEDTLSEMAESGEDVEDAVDTALSELEDVAVDVLKILEDRGFKVTAKIREGVKDVRDILEDVLEEYGGEEEEEV